MISISSMNKFLLSIVMVMLILNPYTIFGNLAYILSVPFVLLGFLKGFKNLDKDVLYPLIFMIIISLFGAVVSVINGIDQFNHLKVVVSFFVYILVGYGVFVYFQKRGFVFDDLVYCALIAFLINSALILLEVFFPVVRDVVESFLVESGNRNWNEGFRYRGIASGGGASLSLSIPVAVCMALYLYGEKYIGILFLVSSLVLLIFSLVFIGRTGMLLLPIVFLSFVFFNFRKYFYRIVGLIFFAFFVIIAGYDYFKQVIVNQFGIGFFNYSFGFLLNGFSGIKEEGTAGIILDFLTVLPTTFPEVFIGYGFYGGSDFYPWTDSGYSRMFLSVGYFFGIIFYMCFFLIFRNVFSYKPYLFFTIGLLLLIGEAKEPIFFSGYASRLYCFLLVFGLVDKQIKKISHIKFSSISTKY